MDRKIRYKIKNNQFGGNRESIEYLEQIYGIKKEELPKNEQDYDIFDMILHNTPNVKEEFESSKNKMHGWGRSKQRSKWESKKEIIEKYSPIDINMSKVHYVNNQTFLPSKEDILRYKCIGIDTEGQPTTLIQICLYKDINNYEIYLIPFKNDNTIYFENKKIINGDIKVFLTNIFKQDRIPLVFHDYRNDMVINSERCIDISLSEYGRYSLIENSTSVLNKNMIIYETNSICPTYTNWGSYKYKGRRLNLLESQKLYAAMDSLVPCMVLEKMVELANTVELRKQLILDFCLRYEPMLHEHISVTMFGSEEDKEQDFHYLDTFDV